MAMILPPPGGTPAALSTPPNPALLNPAWSLPNHGYPGGVAPPQSEPDSRQAILAALASRFGGAVGPQRPARVPAAALARWRSVILAALQHGHGGIQHPPGPWQLAPSIAGPPNGGWRPAPGAPSYDPRSLYPIAKSLATPQHPPMQPV